MVVPEPKASKAELQGFKHRLKYGEDPKEMYEAYREHLKSYSELKDETNDLLIKILEVKSELSDKMHDWTKLEVQDHNWFGDTGCVKSPIGKHIYLYHYGQENPNRDDPKVCLCCDKTL